MSKGDAASSDDSRHAMESLQAAEKELNVTRQELEQIRSQLADYEALLGELPGIFERKYLQRQQPFELQQQLLAKENESLREIVRTARHRPAAPPPAAALTPAVPVPASAPIPAEPSRPDPAPSSPAPAKQNLLQAFPVALAAKGLAILLGFIALGAALGTVRQSLVGQAPEPKPAAMPAPATPAPAARLLPPQPPQTAQTPAKPQASIPPQKQNTASLPSKVAATKPAVTKAPSAQPAANLLVLNSSGPNWVQVRTLNRQPVYEGMLKGQKTLSLGQGLQVLAGRPDLLTVRQGSARPKQLGRIDQLSWFSFRPPAAPALP
ncbi:MULTISPECIES: hypothetical protein [unclassified Synechococcus]|uniref:hypothetical protein n=2 Tax=Synechococcus TaxID=1129 RepID=UPI000DB31FD1|nr:MULTISPECIES: hypothetical protein [unclassified Synechococcus]MCT0214624.1 hypothetical protein [Synechococcus sp. CS-1326]MCT0233958.1 hypothetical protein [Synechococcus sp. CS-1327]PZV05103.1 MAG: hypothetical protein DCF23_04005 [Cyanobium sp.]